MTIGENIRRFRNQMRLTQPELAELSGLSCRGIQGLEYDKYSPKLETLKRIADVLGVPVSALDESLQTEDFVYISKSIQEFSNDELLAEIRRRMVK